MKLRVPFRKRYTGWWRGPVTRHRCKPPVMPRGAPGGLIYRCEWCAAEWIWQPL